VCVQRAIRTSAPHDHRRLQRFDSRPPMSRSFESCRGSSTRSDPSVIAGSTGSVACGRSKGGFGGCARRIT
jgi:hypothetical protein